MERSDGTVAGHAPDPGAQAPLDRQVAADARDAAAAGRDSAAADRDKAADNRGIGRADRQHARTDRIVAASDRLAAEQDRLFAGLDRDFAAFDRQEADRERDTYAGGASGGWTEAARRRGLAAQLRDEAARRRDGLAVHRMNLGLELDREADQRDRRAEMTDALADLRDRAALERDRAAAARDVAAIHRDLLALERDRRVRELTEHGGDPPLHLLVAEAETDRQLATVDRLEAAMDRLAAVQDRVATLTAPLITGIDPDTGALTTGEGLWVLTRLLVDTEATDVRATLVDVGPALERGSGAAGLAAAVDVLRSGLSHRDLVVRWSPTQFLVVVLGAPPALEQLVGTLSDVEPGPFVSHEPGMALEDFLAAVTGPLAAATDA
jgi:hypothetical protein